MSRFPKRTIQFLAVLFLVGVTNLLARVSNGSDTVFTRTRDFLHDFYPELSGRDLFLSLSTVQRFDNSWRVIHRIEFNAMLHDPLSEAMLNPPFDPKTGKQLTPPENSVLKGDILFDHRGFLHAFATSGESSQAKRIAALRDLIQSHPEWSNTDAVRALKQAGAHYGPDEKSEFRKTIQLQKFESFMGSKLELRSIEFESLPENHEGSFTAGALNWSITADRVLGSGKRIPYTFSFEPFDGKLTAVHKQGEPIGILQDDE